MLLAKIAYSTRSNSRDNNDKLPTTVTATTTYRKTCRLIRRATTAAKADPASTARVRTPRFLAVVTPRKPEATNRTNANAAARKKYRPSVARMVSRD